MIGECEYNYKWVCWYVRSCLCVCVCLGSSCLITCFIFAPFPRTTTQFVCARDANEISNWSALKIKECRAQNLFTLPIGKTLTYAMSERAKFVNIECFAYSTYFNVRVHILKISVSALSAFSINSQHQTKKLTLSTEPNSYKILRVLFVSHSCIWNEIASETRYRLYHHHHHHHHQQQQHTRCGKQGSAINGRPVCACVWLYWVKCACGQAAGHCGHST